MQFLLDTHGDLDLLNLITDNAISICIDLTYVQVLNQQVSSLNYVLCCLGSAQQMCQSMVIHQIMWDIFSLQLIVHILHEFCTQIVYIVLMVYTFCRSELMYTKCIQNVHKMYPTFQQFFFTFCIQILAAIFLSILYAK